MSHAEHQHEARAAFQRPIRCAVLTVSDSRTKASDRSGSLTRQRLKNAGHEIDFYEIIQDEPTLIREVVGGLAGKVEVVLLSGGTGVSRRDRTFDVLSGMLEKELPGFGELFRMLSYEEIGGGAMLSRATAGVYEDTVYFSMPGSLDAVKLALDELILPEMRHLVWEVVRKEAEDASNGAS